MSVDVTGTSKGRGYAGVMKRHNFAGQRASHGVKKVHRHAGGTGMSAAPSRLFKGKRMAGQYGNATITTRNLKVAVVDQENNLLLVRGAVPGPNGGYVVIRETNKFNYTVKSGIWFAMKSCGEYSLIGCTVAPAFDYKDFELAPPDWKPKNFDIKI